MTKHIDHHRDLGEDIFSCDQCSHMTGKSSHMKRHVETHKNKLACKLCSFTTNKKLSLDEHTQLHIVQDTSFVDFAEDTSRQVLETPDVSSLSPTPVQAQPSSGLALKAKSGSSFPIKLKAFKEGGKTKEEVFSIKTEQPEECSGDEEVDHVDMCITDEQCQAGAAAGGGAGGGGSLCVANNTTTRIDSKSSKATPAPALLGRNAPRASKTKFNMKIKSMIETHYSGVKRKTRDAASGRRHFRTSLRRELEEEEDVGEEEDIDEQELGYLDEDRKRKKLKKDEQVLEYLDEDGKRKTIKKEMDNEESGSVKTSKRRHRGGDSDKVGAACIYVYIFMRPLTITMIIIVYVKYIFTRN